MNTGGGVDTWTIVAAASRPACRCPRLTRREPRSSAALRPQQGTFTFTVDNVPFGQPGAPPSQGTYSITLGPPLPLQVVLPAGGSDLSPGTVGVAYAQSFFLGGGVAPYTWSVASGQLPPGLALVSTAAPTDNNNQLAGTPTQAGKFDITMMVTDGSGQSASQQFSLTINDQGSGSGGGGGGHHH